MQQTSKHTCAAIQETIMKKNVGLTYVDNFSFPSEQGFTGSAGRSPVKGYMRGGTVGVTTKQNKNMPQKKQQRAAAKKSAMKSHGGSMHDQLYEEGDKMGYMRGGQVKDTSAEFIQQSKKQDTMDHALVPAGSTDAQDKAAGGHKRLKPKFKQGGDVHAVRLKKGGKVSPYTSPSVGNLGEGALARGARAMREREAKIDETAQEAINASRAARTPGVVTQDRPPKAAKKGAPGSERGKRKHYGLPFKSTPMVK
jgi:hypothetical protein